MVGEWIGGWWEGGGRVDWKVVGVLWENRGRDGGCGGVHLELQRGSQGLVRVASDNSGLFSSYEGPVGIPLESLLVNRSVSRVHSELSVSLGQRLGSWASYQGSTRE